MPEERKSIKDAQNAEEFMMGMVADNATETIEGGEIEDINAGAEDETLEETDVVTLENEPEETSDDNVVVSTDETEDTATTEEVTEEVELTEIEDWDTSDSDTDTVSTDDIKTDYSKLANELGITGGNENDIINGIKQLKDAGKEATDVMANVPDSLVKAIEISKQGGDYMDYLGVSSVDYSNIDGSQLYETQLAGIFTSEDGTFDREGYDEYLDTLPDKEIEIRGMQLKRGLINEQKVEQARITQEADTRKVEAERELKQAIDGTEKIRDFVLTPTHKRDMYKAIASGDVISELFYNETGKMDYNKVIKIYFDHKYGAKADEYLKQRITTATKKTFLKDLSNSNIENNSETLTETTVKKSKSGLDLYIAELKGEDTNE